MYQLPLKFIQISPDVAVCATRIVAIMSTRAYQARKTISAERSAGTLINGCGNRTAQAAVFLDNGTVLSSPYTVPTLLNRIDKASAKTTKGEAYEKKYVKVYAVDEENDAEEIDEDAEEIMDEDDFEGEEEEIDAEESVD